MKIIFDDGVTRVVQYADTNFINSGQTVTFDVIKETYLQRIDGVWIMTERKTIMNLSIGLQTFIDPATLKIVNSDFEGAINGYYWLLSLRPQDIGLAQDGMIFAAIAAKIEEFLQANF